MTTNEYINFLITHYQLTEVGPDSLLSSVQACLDRMEFEIKHVVTVSDKRYTDEELDGIEKWCKENCNGKFSSLFCNIDWFFEDDHDAMVFKLTWR